jgi:biopolymer transport protein ExbD
VLRLPTTCAAALLLALLVVACDDRKPVPVISIRVLADGYYEVNHERMAESKMKDEVQRIADENRRDIVHSARVYVRLSTEAGASQDRKSMVMNTCLSAGINSIEQSSADQ